MTAFLFRDEVDKDWVGELDERVAEVLKENTCPSVPHDCAPDAICGVQTIAGSESGK